MVQFLVVVVEDGFSDGRLQERRSAFVLLSFSVDRKELSKMSELSQAKARPLGVTILAILASIAAVLAAIHALQFLGLFPIEIGRAHV